MCDIAHATLSCSCVGWAELQPSQAEDLWQETRCESGNQLEQHSEVPRRLRHEYNGREWRAFRSRVRTEVQHIVAADGKKIVLRLSFALHRDIAWRKDRGKIRDEDNHNTGEQRDALRLRRAIFRSV